MVIQFLIVWAIRMTLLFPLCLHLLFLFPKLSFINPLKYKIFDLGQGHFSNHSGLYSDFAELINSFIEFYSDSRTFK